MTFSSHFPFLRINGWDFRDVQLEIKATQISNTLLLLSSLPFQEVDARDVNVKMIVQYWDIVD